MKIGRGSLFLFLAILFLALPTLGQDRVRVATYNIKFLSTGVSSQGDRLAKLRTVIDHLDADVIGLQEIADRAALNLVFPSQDWHIIIDDDSGDDQDVAVVVRKPFQVVGINADLDADDNNFLFPGGTFNSPFPNRRDALAVEVQVPGQSETFVVIVIHAKARSGGRSATDQRRVGAARLLVESLKDKFSDKDFILLGDFNDNPDDQSMNILETGDPNASAGPEEIDGPFLINLVEPLLAAGHVSHGRTSADIAGDRVNTIDPLSRKRNNDLRGTNANTGDILFDQLLIPVWMKTKYVQGSASVFDREVAVKGNTTTRASDHLPVSAEFEFGGEDEEETPGQLKIVSLLPNPNGVDAGREEVTIRNLTTSSINLQGWKLRDRASNTFSLSGSIPANSELVIRLSPNTMPLNNDGDEVSLIDPQANVRHQVSYTGMQAQSGVRITFP